jgi:16S rRNA (guanine527-N7)-methyltransferase
VRLHLLDSIAIAPDLEGSSTVADLGSGAGLPGLPLSLVLSQSRFTLVESRSRRCSFLREAIRVCGVGTRVNVLEGDAHALMRCRRFDAVVSRAFLPPTKLLDLATSIARPGGRIVVMAGGGDPSSVTAMEELAPSAGARFAYERSFLLPEGSESRRVGVFECDDLQCFT